MTTKKEVLLPPYATSFLCIQEACSHDTLECVYEDMRIVTIVVTLLV